MPQPSSALPLPTLLKALAADGGRPRLTWYGPGGERIELSGHVLDNWVTKTTNLLVEEYQVGPDTRVLLDLPPHWRAVVWAFAVWRAGGCLVVTDSAAGVVGAGADGAAARTALAATADVVVTHRPADYATTRTVEVVAVALPALARSFDGDLPSGATDAAAAVMTYGDVLGWMPEPRADAPALEARPDGVRHEELMTWASARLAALWPTAGWVDRVAVTTGPDLRLLLEPSEDTALLGTLAAALVVYAADGSVVLCAPEVTAELTADPQRRARVIEGERITTA